VSREKAGFLPYLRVINMKVAQRCISIILIICYSFVFTGCFTTKNIYEDAEITITLYSLDIISHQNKMGSLYYTLQDMWISNDMKIYGYVRTSTKILWVNNSDEKNVEIELKDHSFPPLNNEFPYSTYSDAVLARDELLTSLADKEYVITRKEIVKEERVFSPVKTGLAIGLPVLGILTLILGILITPDNTQK